MTQKSLSIQEATPTDAKVTEELAFLIRGFFATPVISSLGMNGALKVILNLGEFTPDDFTEIPNKQLLYYSFRYLARIGLLESDDEAAKRYRLSALGRQVFQRANSFYAPHSYREYMHQFGEQLMNSGPYQKQKVDRLENIIGSGRTHERYFPPAVSYLKRKVKFDLLADIGCGDGRFLEFALKGVPSANVVGIDLSEVSVETTAKNLKQKFPGREIRTICADASDVKKWSEPLKQLAGEKTVAISMWFLLHEISRSEPKNVLNFLKQVHTLFPKSHLVICELVRQSPEVLTRFRKEMIMPEYLLFHDISLQGVLSWNEYQDILKNIPYRIASERLFDETGEEGSKEPATFVWCLAPQ